MRKWNKLLAMVLAMVMVFGLTATAFAEEGDAADDGVMPISQTDEKTPVDGEGDEDAAPADDADAAPADDEDAAPADDEDAAPAEGEDEKTEEPAAPAAVTFSDVEEGRWFYEFVMKMAEAGIVNGNPDGTFNPGGNVTWGQALKMALLAAKYEDAAPVEGGSWASGYIALAKAEGIVAEDAEIDHNAAITRVAMCELLAKALKVAASEKESIFSDTDNAYVMALVELGIISEAEKFNPDNNLSRAELCKILATIPEDLEPAEGDDEDAAPADDEDAAPADDEAEGDDAAEPAEGDDAADPAEGEAEGDDTPAEGEADEAPAADAE